MFGHIFLTRLKCILRDRQTVFWTLAFPILLSVFFKMGLSNVYGGEIFLTIPLAVVEEEGSAEITALKEILEEMDARAERDGGTELFDVVHVSREEAERLLADGKVAGIVHDGDGLKLKVKGTGLEETVVKGFLDRFRQSRAAAFAILASNPRAFQEGLAESLAGERNYLRDASLGRAVPDTVVNFFYTIIAMSCLYGGFIGMKEVIALQANLSPQAARVSVAPARKQTLCAASLLAAAALHTVVVFFQIVFIVLALQIGFGDRLGLVALTALAGSLTGVAFGACVAAALKCGEGLKVGILIASSMTMSLLAGMMHADVKMLVSEHAPLLLWLNPLNLIADAFYKLYFYPDLEPFSANIFALCGFFAIFGLATFLILRRQRYASL